MNGSSWSATLFYSCFQSSSSDKQVGRQEGSFLSTILPYSAQASNEVKQRQLTSDEAAEVGGTLKSYRIPRVYEEVWNCNPVSLSSPRKMRLPIVRAMHSRAAKPNFNAARDRFLSRISQEENSGFFLLY
jgi:hypothetical protein